MPNEPTELPTAGGNSPSAHPRMGTAESDRQTTAFPITRRSWRRLRVAFWGWLAAAEIERLRAEVASLRLTLGGRTFSGQPVPDPIGCPMPGACAQVAEIKRLRRGWLRVIQQENQCPSTGGGCLAKRCGCVEEMELLANEQS